MEQIIECDRLVSPREAARIIGVKSKTTFYALIRRGDLPALIKRGRQSYHLESELLAYIHKLSQSRKLDESPSPSDEIMPRDRR